MSYNHRPLSPGGRRIHNQGRASDNTLTDPYYHQRHNSYTSPRTSGGVIPVSERTYVNLQPSNSTSSRPSERFDSYTGRPRRSSLVDTQRAAAASTVLPARSRPAVIQQDFGRPASPVKNARDKEYYITPGTSQEPRTSSGATHKKLYSVDDGAAKLVADVNITASATERHHKRRDSVEHAAYNKNAPLERERERDRGRRSYHANGSYNSSRAKDKSIDDEDAYSYTDPAAMYRDTEPRWREIRPRRGSLDRGGASSRERPVSAIDPTFGMVRPGAKEIGPPPSTRGWDKINDAGRTRSHRDAPREVAQSPTRGRARTYYHEPATYGDPRDQYYVPPRTSSNDRRATIHNYDSYDYEDNNRNPRRPERRQSGSRDARADPSVERRGFGIRPDHRPESQSRHGGRASEENFEHGKAYRDSSYGPDMYPPPPPAPSVPHHDGAAAAAAAAARIEQEKRDRELAQRLQVEDQGKTRERTHSDTREYSREPRRREDDRYAGDYDRPRDREYDRDRDREWERTRQMEPPSERERERHHHRRDTDRDRDRDYSRKENSPRQSGEALQKAGLSGVASGGLAGAAAAFGLSGLLNKVTEKRDKERDKDRDEYQDRDRDRRGDRSERDDRNERGDRNERRNGDGPPYERDQDRERANKDSGRGLGSSFEAPPEPPRSAPPANGEWNQPPERRTEERRPAEVNQQAGNSDWTQDKHISDRTSDREREYSSNHNNKPAEQPGSASMPLSPEEDYRRRMEQVQRELGRSTDDHHNSDSDQDRERRRREREQRQRERETRSGPAAAASMDSAITEMPPRPTGLRSFDDQSALGSATSTTTSTTGTDLRRRPSILDRPLTAEPAQIIDNSLSEKRENRVRIVDPPSEEEEKRPKGILKKPTAKFPEDLNAVREGVAPLKDASKKGIPPGARWTKIDRRLVNPEALEAAHERFEERLDCVIVLRVLTKEEIQKLADRTRELRDRRFEEERDERRAARHADRDRDRHDRDEYDYSDSEDEFTAKPPKMLEAPPPPSSSSLPSANGNSSHNTADFIREAAATRGGGGGEHHHRHSRDHRDSFGPSSSAGGAGAGSAEYSMSGGLGKRDESQVRY